MKFLYLKDPPKNTIFIDTVQAALKETGAIVDSKLLPIIEHAELGNFEAMADLYEMFVYGHNNVKPNYEMAKRYAYQLFDDSLESGDPAVIFEGLKSLAYMHSEFNETELSNQAFFKCFSYMVNNIEPINWDVDLVQTLAKNLEGYQNYLKEDDI